MLVRLNRVLRLPEYFKAGVSLLSNCQKCQRFSYPSLNGLPSTLSTLVDSRSYCSSRDGGITLPPLMRDGTTLMWPKFLVTLRSVFFAKFVIASQFDRDFDLNEFGEGAKQALHLISNKLAKGEFDDLEDLVAPSALQEIKINIANFSVAQREMLAVDKDDVFFAFPYEVGIIKSERKQQFDYIEGRPEPPQREVEIMVVFHTLRGMNKDREELQEMSLPGFLKDPATRGRIMICNYRFYRDFTEGKEPVWVVNLLNHFIPDQSP